MPRRSLLLRLQKPAYVFRPSQIPRRFVNMRRPGEVSVLVPWGDRLLVNNQEAIGASIARRGVHELAVTEVIYRLVGPGDTTVDLGANLGYDTSLLAHRVGPTGTVFAFEPHPEVCVRLRRNVERMGAAEAVQVYQEAVSDRRGEGFLEQTADFDANTGGSNLAEEGIPVEVTTLDSVLPDIPVKLMKVDIEGQELAALHGGQQTLLRTQYLVFEEYGEIPSPMTTVLSDAGFTVWGITETWRGPRLVEAEQLHNLSQWDAPTFLASRSGKVTQLVEPNGWRCLRRRA
jgi:FkbM family methyltransferase